ncbi:MULTISPECIES: VOC family protein [unclassified Rhodococcus (in: high G+C Gram-positive bacteria)]|uniref:VOC family protein n=1 Tax=unclassified Rhodococcus (in: high G+C Gram-positive bacteria) TaxID=192944 RepID=UPI001639F77F|nr:MULTISPECIES: VOC family protein [unclassified Rhodococcus (in: high G+C Gram-positive bacteria)]MBC2642634.1 VOC family protein [Rhodococcus sp. 3A]MBC2892624.1 VOC family protein [Rhodococcus sp. 4CII]
MSDHHDPHTGLHSEQGALRGEHGGRAAEPIIKVDDLAWLEFEKPDLERAEAFAHAFGFATALRTAHELQLRGTDPGSPCVLIRRGPRSRFVGPAFRAADATDVLRLADAVGGAVVPLPESLGGITVDLTDPSALGVRVVSDTFELPALPAPAPLPLNVGHDVGRVNATQRPPRAPATVQRLGHLVLQTTTYRETLDWYLEHLGLIVSDFLYYPGQRARGPIMSFIRCDRGATPTDHHTLAMVLGPANRYVHSAYQVADLDCLAAGGEYLLDRGYRRSWGIGRHIQGSQIFDYWRDPDGFMVEHFSDGDLFDNTLDAGWAPMTASGLAQWGPPATKDFLGLNPGRESLQELRAIVHALRADNEFDLHRLRGLLKVASS